MTTTADHYSYLQHSQILSFNCSRIKLLSNEAYPDYPPHPRKVLDPYYQFKRSNDYDDNRSRFVQSSPPPVQLIHDATSLPAQKTIKVHQPREDPRLFYESDTYIQENNRKNIEREVSEIFPGREVIHASKRYGTRSLAMRRDRSSNRIDPGK